MNFSTFFIDRPIFATVTSIFIVIVGLISLLGMPVAQYPEIVPPTVQVTASYPGAGAAVVADTVATPIEQQVNGVENMLYMQSQSSSDGSMTLTVTFKLGTDLDTAQVLTQNRVTLAQPLLPQEVKQTGVSTKKKSPNMLLCVNMISPGKQYDQIYISNYTLLQIKDELARLPGVGDVAMFGARDYSMRIWLDPNKLASRNLSASEVVSAVREQNMQVAAGKLGAPPVPTGQSFQLSINTLGRLVNESQFGDIVVKTGGEGQIVRLRDVARIELGAKDYSMNSYLDGQDSVILAVFQMPGSNAVAAAEGVRRKMDELKMRFPQGLDYRIAYDTTIFVKESIHDVVKTLFEAIILVVIVVLVFLQNWRSTLIPLLAVPVSLIGTFAVMNLLGFSLNNISLFGLVLAIGIVVDDAIVVVENVERNMALGMGAREASIQAMKEVSGPVIAVALVLSAVFIPTAFISGITGQFFRQFALTIAVSTLISAFNSLTLSPALAALLLKPHHEQPDTVSRLLNVLLGWFFRLFNRSFEFATGWYARMVGGLLRVSFIVLLVYGGLLFLTYLGFTHVPVGFVPDQDKGYLIVNVQLPDAASLERTDRISSEVTRMAMEVEGVDHALAFVGYSFLSGANVSNVGSVILMLKPFEERHGLTSNKIAAAVRKKMAPLKDAAVSVFGPPPVDGLGSAGGYKMQIQDRGSSGLDALQKATTAVAKNGMSQQGFAALYSSFRANVPQLYLEVDREKTKSMNVPLSEVFNTMQIYLGSLYVNDFSRFGRSFQVTAQAEPGFRRQPQDIGQLKVKSSTGEMVPLETLIQIKDSTGPDRVVRYNMFPAADLTGVGLPGVSSGDAISKMEQAARKELPAGMGFEWTDIAYQQISAGNTMLYIFPICVLFVFLTLAAQYESWSLPMAVILIVPMCLLFAIGGVWAASLDNNIFTQIGCIVLVGLACKNAILIVEFARTEQDSGKSRMDAAVHASKLRLRPILMTSFAFILGVLPLVMAGGAGAEMRVSLGVAVFWGMVGVTLFGIFLTPVFYSVVMKFAGDKKKVIEDTASNEIPS